jgi:hypothetical protein
MTDSELSPRDTLAAAIAKHGLTVDAVFVPFSQSRNKAQKSPSLNWRVTLRRNGKDVLTTDYSSGIAHCSAKANKAPDTYRARDRKRPDGSSPYPGTSSIYRKATEAEALADFLGEWRAAECELGVALDHSPFGGSEKFKPRRTRPAGEVKSKTLPLLPDPVDVIWSLTRDSDALDYPTFEEWAASFGYDPDSRSGEAIYRQCLEIALKMRGSIGEAGLSELIEAGQDF